VSLVTMEQHLGAASIRVNGLDCGINNLSRHIVHVCNVHQIKDQAPIASRDKIFRVIFSRCASGITERLTMIWFLASMNEKPVRFSTHAPLICFVTYKKARVNFNHLTISSQQLSV